MKDKIVRALGSDKAIASKNKQALDADLEAAVAKAIDPIGVRAVASDPALAAPYGTAGVMRGVVTGKDYHGLPVKKPRAKIHKRTPPRVRVARAAKVEQILEGVEKRHRVLKQAYDDAGGFEGLAARAMVMNAGDGHAEDTREHTGFSVSYYQIEVKHPVTEGREPYIAECYDLIEALGMSYSEGNVLKALWRICALRQGKSKRGYDNGKYDAEKLVYCSNRILQEIITPKGKKA